MKQSLAGSRPALAQTRKWALTAFAFLAVLLGLQSPAQAHAVLTKSSPAAASVVQEQPREVVLTFSESISPVNDKIRVTGPDGKRADTGRITVDGATLRIELPSDLKRGTYLVSYRVISADSHPVPGGFTFSYGEVSATPAVPQEEKPDETVATLIKISKYLGYLGLVLLVGAALVLSRLWPARLDRRGPRRLLWIGLGLVGLSTVAGLYLQAPYTNGSGLFDVGGDDLSEVMSSRFGTAMLVRLVVLAVAAIMLRPLMKGTDGVVDRVLVLILAAIGAATWPLAGHPAASPVPPVSVVSDALHLGSVAVWLGGLVMLLVFLLRQADDRELGAILPVWSRWAGVAISVLLLAGVVSALIEIGTPNALVNTTYGKLVLAKIGLVAVIAVAASLARRLVLRGDGGRIRKFVAVEVLVALVVLGVTSVLVQTTPARTAEAIAQQPVIGPTFTATLDSSLYKLQVEIDPAQRGNNLVHLYAYTPDGQPLKVVEWKVTAGLPAAGVEPITVPTLKLTDNHVTGSVSLPAPGDWQLKFTLRISEIDQDTVTLTVPIK